MLSHTSNLFTIIHDYIFKATGIFKLVNFPDCLTTDISWKHFHRVIQGAPEYVTLIRGMIIQKLIFLTTYSSFCWCCHYIRTSRKLANHCIKDRCDICCYYHSPCQLKYCKILLLNTLKKVDIYMSFTVRRISENYWGN